MSYVSQKKKKNLLHVIIHFSMCFIDKLILVVLQMNVRTTTEEDTKSTLKLSFNLLEIDILAFIGYLRM